jgi:hypothetical protein
MRPIKDFDFLVVLTWIEEDVLSVVARLTPVLLRSMRSIHFLASVGLDRHAYW